MDANNQKEKVVAVGVGVKEVAVVVADYGVDPTVDFIRCTLNS